MSRKIPRLLPIPLIASLAGCGPTEVLVGDAPGVARVVVGILGATHELEFPDTAIGGDALTMPIGTPAGLVAFDDGSFYFSDAVRRRIGHVTADGILSWPVGRGTCGAPGAGGTHPLLLCFRAPGGMAGAPDGAIIITDPGAHAVYRYHPADNTAQRLFGTGAPGITPGGSVAAGNPTADPNDVAVAADGTIYVAETANHRIVRIDPDGILRIVAGSGTVGDAGDAGPAEDARLRVPEGVALAGDTVYIADTGNNRIRRVIAGTIHGYAGLGAAGFAGDRGAAAGALFSRPTRLAVAGTLLFVADRDNNRLRVIRLGADSIDTFGGTGRGEIGEDLLEIGRTALWSPAGVATAGRLVFVADSGAVVVRRVVR